MGLKRLSELKTYQKKLEKLLDENIHDIIIFGSLVKGGTPHDVDIAVLVKEREKIESIEFKKNTANFFQEFRYTDSRRQLHLFSSLADPHQRRV